MNPNPIMSEESEGEIGNTSAAAVAATTIRASRRGIVKLMRGDVIRFKARSQLNAKIFFIDYIDDHMLRLIPDMRGKVTREVALGKEAHPHIIMNLDEHGRFGPDEQVEGIELLYRNEEPGYARQRGLVPGTWIEIEYITEADEGKMIVYGEIKTLEHGTDCIGVSIYNKGSGSGIELGLEENVAHAQRPFVFIDFEFKGLSDELRINEIRRCAMPKSLRDLSSGTSSDMKKKFGVSSDEEGEQEEKEEAEEVEASSAGEEDAEEEGDEGSAKNLDFYKSPPAMDDGSVAQEDSIVAGDNVVVVFEPTDDYQEPIRFGVIVSQYYDMDQQRENLRDKLIELDGSTTLSAEKRRLRMIERYTQLREFYSTERDGRKHRTDYYTDDYKPLAELLATYREREDKLDRPATEVIGDWLIPIYIQRRIINTNTLAEHTTFSGMSGVVPKLISNTLVSEVDNYKRYYSGEMSYREYMNAIAQNTTPFMFLSDIGKKSFFNSADHAIEAVSTSPTESEHLIIPSINKNFITESKEKSSFMSITRYLPGDDVPRWSTGYITRPLSYAMLAFMKHSHTSILERAISCQLVASYDRCWLNRDTMPEEFHKIGGREHERGELMDNSILDMRAHNAFAKSNSMKQSMFTAKGVSGSLFDKSVILNMVPSTDKLVDKVMTELRKYHLALSPRILTAYMRPFAIEPHHITAYLVYFDSSIV